MKDKFLKYQAQTTNNPIGLKVLKAEGSYIYDTNNKKYLDFVAGVSASNLGHKNNKIKEAVIDQIEKYWHVMVYGEFIQEPTVKLCELISNNLPNSLSNTYLTNSGTEAMEAAMKLAKRVTARSEFIAAKNSYHGNTQGAMSIMGFEERKRAYRPLLPDINFIEFNNENDILLINNKTSAVILETIQGGAGFIIPSKNYLKKIKNQCEKVGALLILDEIQPGIGRTGKLFAYEHYGIIPDILVYGKGLGGGFPIGALSSSYENMSLFKENPILGHITTFGGHPVIAAAAYANLKETLNSGIIDSVNQKEKLFRKYLKHELIEEVRGKGLMLAIILKGNNSSYKLVSKSLEKGLILFYLLFEPKAVRITPPLTISNIDIKKGCEIILEVLDELKKSVH
ncbi:aminotransferase class III-fold pyridoxal phosphate-dependent enzyme [Flavobacteriaceae bacterium]|nr:aspartate aminotransferase family protein [Flavobacteriaceae bacterium]MDA7567534.1 aminotransferase class III-fold pyridoxal phosphate-dependent enzyme [Flavobacteriaceae bacterium]MDB2567424.1 aminotransferase class III-fold pyridoxal phosphate-dependent enzyme [Flavobacteriaceae bacterium]MDB2648448.1 aminotransferase class III-fold pyridoxal phosphate-dependent enzyme [Flavobacteriaceae bacterium]MDB4601490.1 aminotransferase class III-fold pyridoxal phosphate-dependent enzyme [Flavobact